MPFRVRTTSTNTAVSELYVVYEKLVAKYPNEIDEIMTDLGVVLYPDKMALVGFARPETAHMMN